MARVLLSGEEKATSNQLRALKRLCAFPLRNKKKVKTYSEKYKGTLDGVQYFWTNTGRVTKQYQVIQTLNHWGESFVVWRYFSQFGVGPLILIDGIMNKKVYLNMINENLPVAMVKLVKEWLKNQTFGTMTGPAQSPDFNLFEKLWSIVKKWLENYETPSSGVVEL